MVGVISLHSTDKAGPETWDVKRADGVRAGYSRDRVGTHQPHATENKAYYNKTITTKGDKMKNIIIETGVTRYDLLYGEYEDSKYAVKGTMCCFVWLKNGRGGPSLTWWKGENLYASYLLEKTDINIADLTGILSAIKKQLPDSVGEMMNFDDVYMYKGE